MPSSRHLNKKITFHFLSAIPEVVGPYFSASIFARARQENHMAIETYHLRDWALDKHKKIDDHPYGGGPGMVVKVDVVYRAVAAIQKKINRSRKNKTRIILLSTRGKLFSQRDARRLGRYDHIIFVCGRYEGVDERVARYVADEELSVGPFVVSGGELPAMIIADAIARFIPGVLGKRESLEEIKGSYPTYTRPSVFCPIPKNVRKKWRVPPDLLSGDHKKIQEWRAVNH